MIQPHMPNSLLLPTGPAPVPTARHLPLFGDAASTSNTGDGRARFELPPGRPLAVLCVELEGVRVVTWASGPATGEELLRLVHERMAGVLASADTVDHLAGGSFACLRTGAHNRESLCRLAWRLLDATAAPISVGRFRFTLHPHIGIALRPADGMGYAHLFRNARAAMHRARHQRSGCAFFDPAADVWEHDD